MSPAEMLLLDFRCVALLYVDNSIRQLELSIKAF